MPKKIAAFLILYCSLAIAQAPSLSSVPPTRLAHLRHGINLSELFAQVWDSKGYTKEHFETWTTASDIALIKSAGFDHVRLSVNPQPMMDAAHRSNGSDEYSIRQLCSSYIDNIHCFYAGRYRAKDCNGTVCQAGHHA